jgi:hypothetical protein
MTQCTSSNELLKRFSEGRLASDEAHDLKGHLLQCGECREEAVRKDPLIIFSLLSLRQKEKNFWKDHWERIAASMSVKRAWPWRFPLLQPSPVPAALAAVAVITIMSIVAVLNMGHVEQSVQQLQPVAPYAEKTALSPQPPIVDTTVQPTARVITLSVGDTDVVMIFDENMDI